MIAIPLALATVGGFILLAVKLVGWRGVAEHKAKFDVLASVGAFFLFAGTSTLGIFVAVLTGLFASIFTSAFGWMWPKAQ